MLRALRRALSRLAAERRARRRSSPAISRPCTCRAASMSTCCPASRRSGCSRRWPAASRSSPRPGTTARTCSGPARTSWSRADGDARWRATCATCRTTPDLRARARRAAASPAIRAATPAPTASTSCWPSSPRLGAPTRQRRMETPHEDRLLRLEPAVVLLERRRHLLPRAPPRPRRARPPRSPSTSPTPSTGRSTATSSRRTGRDVVVYPATEDARARRSSPRRASADVVVKASGVGVFDDELLEGVVAAVAPGRASAIFWDVDAPATLAEMRGDRGHPLRRALPALDLVLTYGGGPPVVAAYEGFGARRCVPIYNALDPDHPPSGAAGAALRRPTSPSSATACRTARRGSSSSSSTRRAAAGPPLPARRQRLGRQADAGQRAAHRPRLHARAQRLQRHAARRAQHRPRQHGRRSASRRRPASSRRPAPAPA